MNLDQITTKCWILALIIRDDGERLLLGDGWFDFKDSLQHFQPNSIANDIVELQGTDGQLLAGQVRRSASQSFDGYIGDALTSKTEIENRRRQFLQFFRTRKHYKVIYIFPDGTAIQRRMGYLTDAPSVPEMWQKFPGYHVALNFEDVNYYEYAEDAQGDEIYAHDSLVKLISVQSGGLIWDEIGAVSHGYTWLDPQTVTGDYITVTDGATGSPLTLSQLTGNATQAGTPTPDAPVPISVVTGAQTVKVEGSDDSQDFPIDLGSIELAKIGTYQDRIYKNDGKWYIEKQVGKVVLDSSNQNAWGLYGTGTPNYFYYWQTVPNSKQSQIADPSIMSNYGPQGSVGTTDTNQGIMIASGGLMRVRLGEEMALADWKAKVSNTPMVVYYALATPTTTEITNETLLSQLNFVASLYGGENNISLVGTGAQGTMTLNYYADVDTTGAGYEWEAGEGGGPTIVQVIGVDNAQPIWTVTGPATNPTLTNITTVQTITWNGTVPNGQKLIVDMANQTATLAGANVYEFITGSWITLRPGANKLTYSAQGADQASQIQWNGVVG